MRLYTFMQKSMFGGTMIQPLAHEGFFPDKFAKLNVEGLPVLASKLNLIIVCVSSFI
jgi:amino acid permease